jgi:hypothetical protein
MKLRKRYILLFILLLGAMWFLQNQSIQFFHNHNLQLYQRQIRGLGKLEIKEQSFMLPTHYNAQGVQTYPSYVSGTLGFEINLVDSVQTVISIANDTLLITAPVHISHLKYDEFTLAQLAHFIDLTTENAKKSELIKQLDADVLAQTLAEGTDSLKGDELSKQERQLSTLIGMPVKITLTQMPAPTDLN